MLWTPNQSLPLIPGATSNSLFTPTTSTSDIIVPLCLSGFFLSFLAPSCPPHPVLASVTPLPAPFAWLRDESHSLHKQISLGFICFFLHAILCSEGKKRHELSDAPSPSTSWQATDDASPHLPTLFPLLHPLFPHLPSLFSPQPVPAFSITPPPCVAAWRPPSSPVTQVTRYFVFPGVFACRKSPQRGAMTRGEGLTEVGGR